MSNILIEQMVLGSFSTNCYIVYNKESKEAVVVDPAAAADAISGKLTYLGLSPKAVLLTHGHFDHIGAANEIKNKYDIEIYGYKDEEELIKDAVLNLSSAFDEPASANIDVLLSDGQILDMCGFKIKVIHTPGHTTGSCCYLISDDTDSILISGDTLFYESHGRTDFPTGSESQIYRSITEKLLTLDEDISVYPGHGNATTIGDEKKWYWR